MLQLLVSLREDELDGDASLGEDLLLRAFLLGAALFVLPFFIILPRPPIELTLRFACNSLLELRLLLAFVLHEYSVSRWCYLRVLLQPQCYALP